MMVFLLLFLFQAAAGPEKTVAVQKQIDKIIATHLKKASIWAVSVRDESGTEVLFHQADLLVTPASNQKILSAAAIFENLGSDFRYQTVISIDGITMNGTLFGNMDILASGDPSINKKTWENPLRLFEAVADSLKKRGIKEINGQISIDKTIFDDEPYPEGWEWKDLTFYYGVQIDALSFNDNAVDLEVDASGKPGTTPKISWYPFNTDYIKFNNFQQITAPGTRYRESYHRLPGSKIIVLKSRLPQGYQEKESLSVPAPSEFFLHTFERVLNKAGIKVLNQKADPHRGPEVLLAIQSPPVSELMVEVLAKSNNFYTEMLLKTTAAKAFGKPGTTENGLLGVKNWIHANGMDSSAVVARDGSGMYGGALLTAGILSGTLHTVRKKPWAAAFDSALAAPGGYGTLQKRFKNASFAGNLRAKTGYIAGVRSLSGYLTTAGGNRLSFSLVTNHFTVKTAEIDRIHEQLLQTIYEGL